MKEIHDFHVAKTHQTPIAMLTAYDYSSAQIAQLAEIDVILVGDSLGNVVQGNPTTLAVTLEQMIYHAQMVRQGAPDTFIIVDMPYTTYHISTKQTKKNATKIITQTHANAVKIEGGSPSRCDAIKSIIDCEIPVVAHLGLTPQSINIFGNFKMQGKEKEAQDLLIQQAISIEQAGAFMLVLECIPEQLGRTITQTLKIPTIGIGAGRYTDGQVLVWHDILGLTDNPARFVKKYIDTKQLFINSVSNYKGEVKSQDFPTRENVYMPID